MKEIKLTTGADVVRGIEVRNRAARDMFMMGHSKQSSFEQYFRSHNTDLNEQVCREYFMAGATRNWTYESYSRYVNDKFAAKIAEFREKYK